MITSVKTTMDEVYAGMEIASPGSLNEAAIGSELIYFGHGVSLAATDDIAELAPTVNLFTDTEMFYGVAVGDVTLERLGDPSTQAVNQAPYGAHSANKGVAIKRKGKIWVPSDTQITSRAQGIYVRDADLAGTPATVTSTTFTVAALSGDSFTVTISGYAVQTITFASNPASLAAACYFINQQLTGAVATVSGTDIVLTTTLVGSTITIAATDHAAEIVWDTPVAGTGNVASYPWNSRGIFHAAAAGSGTGITGYTEITAGAKWRAGKTVNAVYYGLLDLDL